MKRIHFYIVDTKLYFSQKVIKRNRKKIERSYDEENESYTRFWGEEEEKNGQNPKQN